MRRILLPLAGLALVNLVGCSLVMGHCDCDQTPTISCHVYPVSAANAPPVAVVPHAIPTETIKDLPRVTPDK